MRNISDLVTLLLGGLRGRSGKWDAVVAAVRGKNRAVGLVAVILAFMPAILLALAVVLFAAAR